MNIYIAGSFSKDHERLSLLHMIEVVKKRYPTADLYIPMDFKVPGDFLKEDGTWYLPNEEWARRVYLSDKEALDNADLVVAKYEGHVCDSGTTWEIGYACGKGIPVIGWIPEYVVGDVSLMVMNGFFGIMDSDGNINENLTDIVKRYNQK